MERKKFKIYMRVGSLGSVYAMSEYEAEGGNTLDELWSGQTSEDGSDESYEDRVIEVDAPIPKQKSVYDREPDAVVTLPDLPAEPAEPLTAAPA